MFAKRIPLVLVTAILPGLAVSNLGCHGPCHDMTATQLQMSHMERTKAEYGRHFNDMVDNATLQDMSLVDFHFVAHSDEISGTGVQRLDRMAHLLNTYGGTVRYETDIDDEVLVNKRIEHVREYLTVVGVNMDRVDVKPMLSGGRTVSARKAIEVEMKGTAKPTTGTSPIMMAPGSANGR